MNPCIYENIELANVKYSCLNNYKAKMIIKMTVN